MPANDHYFSPEGYLVMTEAAHWARGHCCGSRCRHCPYGFAGVVGLPGPQGPLTVRRPTLADVPALALLARQTYAAAHIAQYAGGVGETLVPFLATAFAKTRLADALTSDQESWWVAVDAVGTLWGYARDTTPARAARVGLPPRMLYYRRNAGAAAALLAESVERDGPPDPSDASTGGNGRNSR